MKKITALFGIFICSLLFGQISAKKMDLLSKLSKSDRAESSNIGYGGEESNIYKEFQLAKSKFYNKELLFLAINGSNALRFYSSVELIERNEPLIVALYDYYIFYPLKMHYLNGCVGGKIDLAEMIYQEFENKIYLKTELEKMLKEAKKEKSEENIKYYQAQLDKVKTVLKPEFFKAFEKIKKIKENSQNNPNYFPVYQLPSIK